MDDENEGQILNDILSVVRAEADIEKIIEIGTGILNFEGLKIDMAERSVVREDRQIKLTYTEFEILYLLASNPGRVFSKEQIYNLVWKESCFGDYNIVMSHIRNIREKIEDDPHNPVYIQTVWGTGYCFNKGISGGL